MISQTLSKGCKGAASFQRLYGDDNANVITPVFLFGEFTTSDTYDKVQ